MELAGDRVSLRPLAPEDAPRLAELGAAPEVARWWPGLTEEHLDSKARRQDGVACFAIVVQDEVAGMIQYHEEDDPEYRHAGIDLFLGAPWQGRELGADAVRTMALHLTRDPRAPPRRDRPRGREPARDP